MTNKVIYLDRNGQEYLVEILPNGVAKLFDSGYEIFRGPIESIERLGLRFKGAENSAKVSTQKLRIVI